VAALTAVGVTIGLAANGSLAAAAEDAADPPSIVEDFSYPGREQILAERGLKLHGGDGNILYVDCDVEGDKILVESYQFADYVCFQLRGEHGYLSLEIARTTYLYSENQALDATLSIAGQEDQQHKHVPENYWTGVGEAENLPSATLLEIRA
jgi:prepilin-type processing-associated H-X9-DG protein